MDRSDPFTLPEPDQLVGLVIAERYRLVTSLSAGSTVARFDAVDEQTGRLVTVKLVRPDRSSSPQFRERFDHAMRAAAALSHPNIAAVYDWGVTPIGQGESAYVVAEQLTGGSLRDMFDRGRRLSPSQALGVGLEACKALDYAHRRGQIHGEITPAKLVFGGDRRLRIVDFGLARLLGEPLWEHPENVPTDQAWYAAPEQGVTTDVTDKIDVYSLCLSLNEAVTGELPFKSDSTVRTLANRVDRLLPVSADLGPLAAVLEKAGRPEADERSSAADLGRDLVRAASKLPRPEPLPLLSTGLFDVPANELRTPDDPTGGVRRDRVAATEPIEIHIHDDDAPHDQGDSGEQDETAHGDQIDATIGDDAAADEIVEGSETGEIAAPSEAAGQADPDQLASSEAPEPREPVETLVIVDTGGALDPSGVPAEVPMGPEIIEAEPDREIPRVDPTEDVVIAPLDAPIDVAGHGEPAGADKAAPVDADDTASHDQIDPTEQIQTVDDAEPAAQRRRSRPSWFGPLLKLVLGLTVIAALVAIGLTASRLFTTTTHTVPNLAGMPEAEARNLVSANQWQVSIERERSDDVPDVGMVVRTQPGAGVELAEDEPFLIVVSEGPKLRELPEASGRLLADVQPELVDLGLGVDAVDEFDEVVAPGVVISWSVPDRPDLGAGGLVEPGTGVQLVVSRGPAPRQVPNLIGTDIEAARQVIADLQLELKVGGEEFDDDAPAGDILTQDLAPDGEVERGSEITVVVSKGPDLVAFPDLSSADSFEAAQQLLAEAGFTSKLVFGDADGTEVSYTINGARPEVGQTFRRGTQVDLRVL